MSRWHNAAEYAEELDHQLEALAASVRRAPGATTDREFLEARWHATGLERARELVREVLNAGPSRAAATAECTSTSSLGLRCTLPRGHGGVHQGPGQQWLTAPRDELVCSRCLRRQSQHGSDGRDSECPDGFVARADAPPSHEP